MKRDKRSKALVEAGLEKDREFALFASACEVRGEEKIRALRLYDWYKTWRLEAGIPGDPMSVRAFGLRAGRRFERSQGRNHARTYRGVLPPAGPSGSK